MFSAALALSEAEGSPEDAITHEAWITVARSYQITSPPPASSGDKAKAGGNSGRGSPANV